MRELLLHLVQQLPYQLQDWLFTLQLIFMSPQRLERAYLIVMLVIVLLVATEKLRNPRRKLRNRSDRVAWGQR